MRIAARDRRALVLLIVLAAPLLLYRLILEPSLEARSELAERVRREALLLEGEESDLRAQDEHRRALADARKELERATAQLFRAESRPLAEAGAAEYVRTVAALSQVQLRVVDTPGGDSIAPGFGSGRIRVGGDAALVHLLLFLRRLEEGPGKIVTHGIAIQPSDGRREASVAGALSFELALDAHYLWNAGSER